MYMERIRRLRAGRPGKNSRPDVGRTPESIPAPRRVSIRAVLEQTTPPGATLDIQPMETRILGPDRVYEFGTSTLS